MKRLLLLFLVVAAGGIGRTAPSDVSAAALGDFFKPGVVWQDRNGDGAIDFVDAHIVLPDHPGSGELAAAADIAARLGFETSAMDLPLARHDGGLAVFVGSKSLARAEISLEAIGAGGLKPGDGLVTAFTVGGRQA